MLSLIIATFFAIACFAGGSRPHDTLLDPLYPDVFDCANEGGWCVCTGEVEYWRKSNSCLFHYDTRTLDVVGGIQCSNDNFGDPAPGCDKKCRCKPSYDLNFFDYNLASPWRNGKASDCHNLGCSTESGGLESCRAKCENSADCNVFLFCSKEASCPTNNRCCIRKCAGNDDIAEYDLKLTSRWGGWNTYAKRKAISDFKLEVPHTYGAASACTYLGCTYKSNAQECATYCNDNSNCNVMLFCAEGSNCTSGKGRCCIRDCDEANYLEDLELSRQWRGWDIWVKESRRSQ